VFAKVRDWFDHRTGCRNLISALLLEHIPGGAKWRYVWGSTLAFVFTVQLITGVMLMTAYSPGATTAWGSVWFIQYEMDFGWLIRGLHHFGSQAMVVLLGLHMLQVVIAGAQLPPREVNWWLGLALMAVVLALSLTGYLLPWDQKGYWATQVATNIASNLPGVGPWIAKVIVGGSEYGHATVTRFYALHVGILPPLLIGLLIAHLAVFRRHGVTTPPDAEGEGWFWPDQAFRDLLASLVIFGIILSLVLARHGHPIESADPDRGMYERWAHAGRDGRGANLDAPADPSQPYPARPEWYFFFLFQLLKYFEGDKEIVGTVIIPNAAVLILVILPLLGYGAWRRFGHIAGVVVVTGLLTSVGALTCLAIADDMIYPPAYWLMKRAGTILFPVLGVALLLAFLAVWRAPERKQRKVRFWVGSGVVAALLIVTGNLMFVAQQADARFAQAQQALAAGDVDRYGGQYLPAMLRDFANGWMSEGDKEQHTKAKTFREELFKAEAAAARAVKIAGAGIPAEGPVQLLRRDPRTRGKELFGQHCATCHTHGSDFHNEKPTASDLEGFGTQLWILRLLTNPSHDDFFGRTKLNVMADFIDNSFPNVTLSPEETLKLSDDERVTLKADLEDLRLLSIWLAKHPRGNHPDWDKDDFKKGFQLFKKRECLSCHSYEGQGGTRRNRGPSLTGYGDADWLRLMIMAPHHSQRYGVRNTMPAFRDLEGPTSDVTRHELELRKQQLFGEELAARNLKEDDDKAKSLRAQVEAASKTSHLTEVERELIMRFILKDDRVVFGGDQVSGPAQTTPGNRGP
jgi:quinol-cytochrome oxidoreductase complex cytochrome b subunit/mono/diheme cytochrome c family protein